MKWILIGRLIDSAPAGEYEYILDSEGQPKRFSDKPAAILYLNENLHQISTEQEYADGGIYLVEDSKVSGQFGGSTLVMAAVLGASLLMSACAASIKVGKAYTNPKGDTIVVTNFDGVLHQGANINKQRHIYILNPRKLKLADTVIRRVGL